jgi:hypothetical protein
MHDTVGYRWSISIDLIQFLSLTISLATASPPREDLDPAHQFACRIGAHRVVQCYCLDQVEEFPLTFADPLNLQSKRALELTISLN